MDGDRQVGWQPLTRWPRSLATDPPGEGGTTAVWDRSAHSKQRVRDSLPWFEGWAGSLKGSLGNCCNQLALLGPAIMPACFPALYYGLVMWELACGSFSITQAQMSHILPPIRTWNQNILALVLLSLLSPCASLTERPSEILEVCSQAVYSTHSLKWDYSRDK